MGEFRNLTIEEKMQDLKEFYIWHEGRQYKFGFKGAHEEFIKWFNDYVVKTFPKCELCNRLILPFKSVAACGKRLSHVHCSESDIAGFSGFMDEDGKVRPEKDLGKYKEVKPALSH